MVDSERPEGLNDKTDLSDHASVAFSPPMLLMASIAVGFVLRWVEPLPFLPDSVALILGPILTVAAFGLAGWSMPTLLKGGASIPTSEPTDAIVSVGPFRFSRNPIYVSMVLLVLGLGIWSNSLWFVVLAAIAGVLLNYGVIVREERYLERKFGGEYEAYRSRVRRWL